MIHDDLDRILSEEEILPSSGFAAAVMDAVRREAAAPPPIPFPWKRALPGLAIAALALLWALVSLARLVGEAATARIPVAQSPVLAPIWQASTLQTVISAKAGWVTLALVLTLASVIFSVRLASGRT